uniref:Uncharacterized protein n=1 Tax=Chlamydomonas leiostraca TaxID=1034604 RepID=A0A7S0RN21_9CHLO|mmetsp:Transcript_27139/g.69024  ORF Transcript_27139/g.69024 Transcript_27139/m.69024 type:complete len:454 (+) Transcript_27139:121-1482(+)
MGWESEACAFHCSPVIASALQATAATAPRTLCRAWELWMHMLEQQAKAEGLVNAQGQTCLTGLVKVKGLDEVLPQWLLQRSSLDSYLLVGSDDQVYLDTSTARSTSKRGPSRRELADTLHAMEAALSTPEASHAATSGFLMLQPPLPTQLLAVADARTMLALSRTCRALRCAAYELIRREQCAWLQMTGRSHDAADSHAALHDAAESGTHTGLQHHSHRYRYVPLQPTPAAIKDRLHSLWPEQRRWLRKLSLLHGSPEAAMLQHRAWEMQQLAVSMQRLTMKAGPSNGAGSSHSSSSSGSGSSSGRGGRADPGISVINQQSSSDTIVQSIELRPMACDCAVTFGPKYALQDPITALLHSVPPEISQLQKVSLLDAADEDEGYPRLCELSIVGASQVQGVVQWLQIRARVLLNEQRAAGVAGEDRDLQVAMQLLGVARGAAEQGHVLCLLQTRW